METGLCRIDGCFGAVYVKSSQLCSRHYNRLRTTGKLIDGPRARASPTERFWRYVEKRGADECWNWTGNAKVDGYGYFGLGGRDAGKMLAHRASWIIHNGSIPDAPEYHGTVVLHTCDNRACVNPSHLRLGTQSENVRDMDAKGRRKTFAHGGEDHHNARFTDDDVRYIRSSPKSNAELGREFGCARQVIGFVRRRITWKHVL